MFGNLRRARASGESRVDEEIGGLAGELPPALAQIDLAFVRKDSALRNQAAFFNPDQLADYLKTSGKLRGAEN